MPYIDRATPFTTQPGKAIWITWLLLYNTFRLPLWMLYFIPKALRPDSRWTWGQALRIRIVKAYVSFITDIESSPKWNLLPGPEKDQWVTFDAAPSNLFTSVTLVDPRIKPVRIGGTWYPSQPQPQPRSSTEKVVLHFHGGAYVTGDSRKDYTGPLAKLFLKHAPGISRVFCAEYRLASNPKGQFPAALQDAVSAYSYLVNDKGISPANIIVSGDSAGANLTLALLRYIADHGSKLGLPAPSCAWLWSPWVHPGDSNESYNSFYENPHTSTDYVPQTFGVWGVECFQPEKDTGLTYESEYINFRAHQFRTETPLFFSLCEKELLWFDGLRTFDGFKGISGNRVELSVEVAAPHDVVLIAHLIGFEAVAVDAVKKAGKFLAGL